MGMCISNSQNSDRSWAQLYLAAIFEQDVSLVSVRIFEAEQALALRAHELFHQNGDHIEEQSTLDDAMYALHALRNSLEHGSHTHSGVNDCAA